MVEVEVNVAYWALKSFQSGGQEEGQSVGDREWGH